MPFVIYHKETTQLYINTRHRPFRRTESYKTMAAAQAARTRLHKQWLVENSMPISNDGPLFTYAIADQKLFHDMIEKRVVKRNLMSGVEYEERVNTPSFCSPSSEAYWSM